MLLGDVVERALELVGVDQDFVMKWLGQDCNSCQKRKEKLNDVHRWAKRVVSGKVERAKEYLSQLLGEER